MTKPSMTTDTIGVMVDWKATEQSKEGDEVLNAIRRKYGNDIENITLKTFHTEKGAVGWCRRKNYVIKEKTENGAARFSQA